MSKRTKLKLRNLRMYLIKYVFNGKYIVRNTLAATVIMTVIVSVLGLSMVLKPDSGEEAKAETLVAENNAEAGADGEVYAIQLTSAPQMNQNSINVLMAGMDSDSQTMVSANEPQMVTESNGAFDNKFIAIEDGVNIRQTASTGAEVVGALYLGDIGDVLAVEGEWVHITFGDVTGYVKAEFVLMGSEACEYAKNMPAEEEADEEEAGTEQASNSREEEKKEDSTEEEPESKMEEQPESKTEEPATTEAADTTDNFVYVGVSNRGSVSLSESDLNLMASIMTLECGGESYEGQLAVANVILNRLQSGSWGSTMTDVIYAPGQFSTASSSKLDYYLQNGAQASCLDAAREALSGTNNIGSFMYFKPVSLADPSAYSAYTIIGNHFFY